MKIKVKLFAALRQYSPGGPAGTPFEVELPDGANINVLLECLNIPAEQTKVAFVNGITQPMDYPLHPSDEVGIFPPVGGG